MARLFPSQLKLLISFLGIWTIALLGIALTLPTFLSSETGNPSAVARYLHSFVVNTNDVAILDFKVIAPKQVDTRNSQLVQLPPTTTHDTGAFANCTEPILITPSAGDDPDQRNVTVSCRSLVYRMHSAIRQSEPIIIGVLSAAGGNGPARRDAIRNTWASGHSVFFIVAGPWDEIQEEYRAHLDLIWLDQEESYYEGLTLKTMVFIQAIHDLVVSQSLSVSHVFKTDDDSFVNTRELYRQLLVNNTSSNNHYFTQSNDYWGKCTPDKLKPYRDTKYKWSISDELYPEQYYPLYCQGAGFAISRKFIDCAANSIDANIATMRFMPFEDTAVGLLAERCGLQPTDAGPKMMNQMRTSLKLEHRHVKHGLPKIDKKYLTIPAIVGRVVQHRIYDEWDMEQHWLALNNPLQFKAKTTFPWYKPKYHEIYRWVDDVENNPNARKRLGLE
jgi:hypothetical protein